MALGEVPPGWKVTWVPVPVRPSVAGMRRAVFDALALAGRFPHTSALADAAVTGALSEARVLVVDEAQRLPVPCLEYLQSLWDHPGTRITLVLCGPGPDVDRPVVRARHVPHVGRFDRAPAERAAHHR
ncbi:ATP-binding protein [Streptomyces echinatus]|uniref:ATP-binding protein n=1 Tax=Streptomyces echinatus TaxID=67293 RepID=UPI001FCFC03E|nr:ATP-binding protein [Streptomyces echinatus]